MTTSDTFWKVAVASGAIVAPPGPPESDHAPWRVAIVTLSVTATFAALAWAAFLEGWIRP